MFAAPSSSVKAASNGKVASESMPAWMASAEAAITESPTWQVLTEEMFAQMQERLEKQQLGQFSDLQAAEQIAVIDELHRGMVAEKNPTYQAFEWQLGRVCDEHIAAEAHRRLNDAQGRAVRHITEADEHAYLDHLLHAAADGATAALCSLPPHQRVNLQLMLNEPIPSRSRRGLWKAALSHPVSREQYERLCKKAPASTISVQDVAITQRCQALLEAGRLRGAPLLPLSTPILLQMKTVLSYHHACCLGADGAAADMSDGLLYCLMPLIKVLGPQTQLYRNQQDDREQATLLAELVECFEALLDSDATLLQMVTPPSFYHRPFWGPTALEVMGEAAPELVAHATELHIARKGEQAGTDTKEEQDEDEVSSGAHLDAVTELLQPLVGCALVSWLSTDACLFAWDQSIMGGFGEMVPRLAALVAAALTESLLGYTEFEGMQEVLLAQASAVTVPQLQELMSQYCVPALRSELLAETGLDTEVAVPSLADATAIFERALLARQPVVIAVDSLERSGGSSSRPGTAQRVRPPVAAKEVQKPSNHSASSSSAPNSRPGSGKRGASTAATVATAGAAAGGGADAARALSSRGPKDTAGASLRTIGSARSINSNGDTAAAAGDGAEPSRGSLRKQPSVSAAAAAATAAATAGASGRFADSAVDDEVSDAESEASYHSQSDDGADSYRFDGSVQLPGHSPQRHSASTTRSTTSETPSIEYDETPEERETRLASEAAARAVRAGEREDISKAQQAVFGRTYTAAQVQALTGKEHAAYTKRKGKFLKKYAALREQRRKQEIKAAKAAAAAASPKKHWWSKS